MRGQVKFRKESIAYIKASNQKETYVFNEKSVIDVPFSEIKDYDFVDFYGTNYDGKFQANYVRKAGLEWQKGVIVEVGDDDDAYWRIKSEGGRIFWFKKRCICIGEKKEDFSVGDIVRFQCGGYYSSGGNQALMVTKKHIGYIISYNIEEERGIIDFNLPFSIMHINNPLDYCLDTERYFYFVSYELSEGADYAENITILAEEKDIIFDEAKKWIDGIITKVVPSQEYCIVSPIQNPHNTFRVGPKNLEKCCDFNYVKKGQHVSFLLKDEPVPQFVEWLGYITRFPTNSIVKDQSGRINPNLDKYEAEKTSPKPALLFFFKNKIINSKHNETFTHFWVTAKFCGEDKDIPIRTAYTNLRYKVRFAFTDDKVYGVKAKHISVIGIEKAPIDSVDNDKSEDIKDTVIQNNKEIVQNVKVINNFYHPIYAPTVVVNKVKNVDDFLELVKTNSLSKYIENIWKKTISAFHISPDGMGNYYLSEKGKEVVEYFGNKIFSIEGLQIDEDSNKKLDETFEAIRNNIYPEISNELLKVLSPKCKIYVEVAAIVENTLKNVTLCDYSAILVMYGKALEQELRDSLYRVIQNNDILNKLTDSREIAIATLEREKTTIGNYTAYITNNIQILSEETENLQKSQTEVKKSFDEWCAWWEKLCNEIRDAGNIRNRSDHAGLNILISDLHKMKKLLFVNEGIFESLNLINILAATKKGSLDCKVRNQKEVFIENSQAEFIGEWIQGNYLIVGKLSSGEKASLFIDEISEKRTTYNEFLNVFEQSKHRIEVKILRYTPKGYQVSLKK